MAAQGNPDKAPRTRHMTWMEMCLEDVGAHFGFTALIPRGSKKSQVRQCLGFCTADSYTNKNKKSAVQKPKHYLT